MGPKLGLRELFVKGADRQNFRPYLFLFVSPSTPRTRNVSNTRHSPTFRTSIGTTANRYHAHASRPVNTRYDKVAYVAPGVPIGWAARARSASGHLESCVYGLIFGRRPFRGRTGGDLAHSVTGGSLRSPDGVGLKCSSRGIQVLASFLERHITKRLGCRTNREFDPCSLPTCMSSTTYPTLLRCHRRLTS